MVDIYFKCDWCRKIVEHKHIEKGTWISSDAERTHKLNRVTLNGEDSQICEDCYKAIQKKMDNLIKGEEYSLNEISSTPCNSQRCEKPAETIYVEYTDKDRMTFDKNMPEISRSTSKDYQDSGVVTTCENE